MRQQYQHGLVIGKFYPPHRGHEYLIRCAAEQAVHVSVIVMAADQETIPLNLRLRWLREIFAAVPGITVVGVVDNDEVDYSSEHAWRAHVEHMRRGLVLASEGRPVPLPAVDAVFTSESYGDELARRFAAKSVCIDQPRLRNPISGTAFRNDPVSHWFDIAPCVRESLCQRIVIVGAESTGKSTLAESLLQAYRKRGGPFERTQLVEEFGREYTLLKLAEMRARHPDFPMEQLSWSTDEFEYIAREQQSRENAAARSSGPILLCDTDAFATGVWHERYTNQRSRAVEGIAASAPTRAGYLLTEWKEVPFEQDGLRDGEYVREWMHGRFLEELRSASVPWLLLEGTVEQRMDAAVTWIDDLLRVSLGKLRGV
jgi:HTH-type transcriptional regulator, transcriptional repressor of NAD biosynthesis genes